MDQMHLEAIDGMDEAEVRRYLKFLLWNYRVADAMWFLFTEKRFGLTAAEELNRQVWGKVAGLAARDLKKIMDLRGTGLRGFLEALKLYPWTLIVGYDIEDRGDELILSVPHCPPQEARTRHGLGEYACMEMHYDEFERFAREIDPRIRVECVFAPPAPRRDGRFCQWRFTLKEAESPA